MIRAPFPAYAQGELFLSLNRHKSKAEAEIVVSAVGTHPVPMRGTATPGVVSPMAAPDYSRGIGPIVFARKLRYRLPAVSLVVIKAPLPDIAAHVVKTEFVRLFHRYRMASATGITVVPADFTRNIAAAVFVPPAPVAAACGVLPLRFCR